MKIVLSENQINNLKKTIEKDKTAKWISCVNCNKKFTQTIHKGKVGLKICPHCGTHNAPNDVDEVISINPEKKDIVNKTKDQMDWMDYRSSELKKMAPENHIKAMLKMGMDILKNKYKLKRVVVKDDDVDVGFLIYSKTTENMEKISDNTSKSYDVVLATAINPKYRQQGLLKRMMESANINRPFFVQTSLITTPLVWEKLGCSPIRNMDEFGPGNVIQICK